MGSTRHERLEARRRDLEDQVVVYALTGRRAPEGLVRAYADARAEAEAARHAPAERASNPRHGLVDRLFGHPAAG